MANSWRSLRQGSLMKLANWAISVMFSFFITLII